MPLLRKQEIKSKCNNLAGKAEGQGEAQEPLLWTGPLPNVLPRFEPTPTTRNKAIQVLRKRITKVTRVSAVKRPRSISQPGKLRKQGERNHFSFLPNPPTPTRPHHRSVASLNSNSNIIMLTHLIQTEKSACGAQEWGSISVISYSGKELSISERECKSTVIISFSFSPTNLQLVIIYSRCFLKIKKKTTVSKEQFIFVR